jgi:hypothetical protein
MLAGHSVTFTDTPQARPEAGDQTIQGFVVAESDRGPQFPVRCTSLAAVVAKFGPRVSYSYLYDAAETFFAESGGAPLWVSRIASSTAVTAVRVLSDGSATTLTVRPMGPGTFGNSMYAEVLTNAEDPVNIPSGSFQIRIYDGGTTSAYLIETSPVFVDKTEALLWAPSNGQGNAQTFRLTDDVGTGDPAALTPAAFGTGSGGNTAGADNRGGIADADWQAALDRFTTDLGAGKVFMPGQTTANRQLMLAAHARTRNRHGIPDVVDSPTVATLVSAMSAINAAPSMGARFVSSYWPWYQIPPLTGAYGYRTVPPSAGIAGLWARAEMEGGDPGIAAAGEEHGVFRYVRGLSQDPTLLSDANLESLDAAGLNVAKRFNGITNPVQYGNRTPRSRSTDAVWAEAAGSHVSITRAL